MNKLTKIAALMLATMVSGSALAATQGALVHGTDTSITSEGSLDVLLNIDYVIQVNKLDDIDLGNFRNGIDSDLVGQDSFCVFTNAPSFSVVFAGGNAAGFEMKETNNNALRIPYGVEIATIDTSNVRSNFENVTHNVPHVNINETRNRKNCNIDNGNSVSYLPNLELKVTVDDLVMLDAIPGSYKDTITVVASPE
jgi:hypothetical protein